MLANKDNSLSSLYVQLAVRNDRAAQNNIRQSRLYLKSILFRREKLKWGRA